MSIRLFLLNDSTGRKYEVLGRDAKAGTLRLKGPLATFDEPEDPERLKRLGYRMIKESSDA